MVSEQEINKIPPMEVAQMHTLEKLIETISNLIDLYKANTNQNKKSFQKTALVPKNCSESAPSPTNANGVSDGSIASLKLTQPPRHCVTRVSEKSHLEPPEKGEKGDYGKEERCALLPENKERHTTPKKTYASALVEAGPISSQHASALIDYSKILNPDRPFPSRNSTAVQQFIASDPVHGPVLKAADEAANVVDFHGGPAGAKSAALGAAAEVVGDVSVDMAEADGGAATGGKVGGEAGREKKKGGETARVLTRWGDLEILPQVLRIFINKPQIFVFHTIAPSKSILPICHPKLSTYYKITPNLSKVWKTAPILPKNAKNDHKIPQNTQNSPKIHPQLKLDLLPPILYKFGSIVPQNSKTNLLSHAKTPLMS